MKIGSFSNYVVPNFLSRKIKAINVFSNFTWAEKYFIFFKTDNLNLKNVQNTITAKNKNMWLLKEHQS